MARQCKHWLDTYLEYTHDQESPKAFHYWTALTILSSVLGRNIYINRGYYTLFPNIFVILVAGSAKCRKSVSTGIGINILKSIESPPMIFSQKITNEALIQALVESRVADTSTGLVYASELSVFMGQDATKSGLIPTLTDLYDSPSDWSYRTRGRGVEQLKNVTVSILAASTKDWLRASIPIDAIGGGFTSRILFVYQDRPGAPNLFPSISEHNEKLRHILIADLNHIQKVRGQVQFNDAAIKFATDWYEEELNKVRDEKVEGYFARKHDTMFKIATLLSVCESDDLLVRESHIKLALQHMEKNEEQLHNVIASVVAAPVGGLMERILNMIRKNKRVSHQELLQYCWRFATAEEVAKFIRTLVEGGEIKEEIDGRTRYYRS